MRAKFLPIGAICLLASVIQIYTSETGASDQIIKGGDIRKFPQNSAQSNSGKRRNAPQTRKLSSSFSSRMMSHSEPKEHQDNKFISSDSWHSHNLMPTYADREQGDEMIALASSIESVMVEAPNGRYLMPNDSIPQRSKTSGTAAKNPAKSQLARQSSKQVQSDLNDEYYQDDEDDSSVDGDELGPSFGLSKSFVRHEPERKASSQLDGGNESTEAITNQTTRQLMPPGQPAWSPNVQVDFNEPGDPKSRSIDPNQLMKSANFLSNREPMSNVNRADAAIEYLKKMLKGKQQPRNGTESGDQRYQADSDLAMSQKSRINLQRLTSITLRLNQLLENGEKNSSETPIPSSPKPEIKFSQQSSPSESLSRFSILDAKSADIMSGQAKPKGTEGDDKPQSSESGIDPIGQKNGTPLGGEYIESQDDFPRSIFGPAKPIQLSGQLTSIEASKQADKFDISSQALITKSVDDELAKDRSIESEKYPPASKNLRTDLTPKRFSTDQGSDEFVPLASTLGSQLMSLISPTPHSHYSQLSPAIGQQNGSISHSSELRGDILLSKQEAKSKLAPIPSSPAISQSSQSHNGKDKQQQQNAFDRPSFQPPETQSSPLESQISGLTQKLAAYEGQSRQQQHQLQEQQQQKTMELELAKSKQIQPAAQLQPKIIQYNIAEPLMESSQVSRDSVQPSGIAADLVATNYQLADALYSSTGTLEQLLSGQELEAIKRQILLSAGSEPIEAPSLPGRYPSELAYPSSSISGSGSTLLATSMAGQSVGLEGNLNVEPQVNPSIAISAPPASGQSNLQTTNKLSQSNKEAEEILSELGSEQSLLSTRATKSRTQQTEKLAKTPDEGGSSPNGATEEPLWSVDKKKKSLIVYLNHPKSHEMQTISKIPTHGAPANEDSQWLNEELISAREFDALGLAKEDPKQLEVANFHKPLDSDTSNGTGNEKDGLSMVVIGDAYKYKKIILLISSKSGGLKFVPMVKDSK